MNSDLITRSSLPSPPSLPLYQALFNDTPFLQFVVVSHQSSLLLCSSSFIRPLTVRSCSPPHVQVSAEVNTATQPPTPSVRFLNNNQYVIDDIRRFPRSPHPVEACVSAAELEAFLQKACYDELIEGTYSYRVPPSLQAEWSQLFEERAARVKESMLHFWNSYRKHAFGHDELRPLSKSYRDNWGHIGLTLIDALDTLWLMGLKEEFDEAVVWVHTGLRFDGDTTISVFEFTIRVVGGLISAYHMSGDARLLPAILDAGKVVLSAFDDAHVLPHVLDCTASEA